MSAVASPARRFFVALARDRGRVVWAGIGAMVLWYLLGQEVLDSDDFSLPIHAVGPLDREPEGDALILRVPKDLAFVGAEPASVYLTVKGTHEDVAQLEGHLRGSFDVPADFCGVDSQRTKQIDVTRSFLFPRLKSISGLDFAVPAEVALTFARRAERAVTLSKDNLEFDPASMRAEVDVEFEPAFVSVSGPADEVTRLEHEPGRLKLATVSKDFVTAATAAKRALRADIAWLIGGDAKTDIVRSGLVVNGGRAMQVSFRRRRADKVVELENVEISALIPPAAWREGANRADPVRLKEKSAKVTLSLPESLFTTEFGGDDAQLRRQLSLFVNLRDLVSPKVTDRLKVRVEGLPEGATIVSISPDAVDVEWNIAETTPGKTEHQ